MNEYERIAKIRKIKTIIQKQMGDLYNWEKPEIVQTVGPYFPNAFDHFEDSHKAAKQRLLKNLDAFSIDDLIDGFDGKGNLRLKPTLGSHGKFQFIANEVNGLNTNEPVWFSGGFGHPDYYTDVGYWSKFLSFKSDELFLLSLGLNPHKIKVRDIYNHGKHCDDDAWEVFHFFSGRLILFDRLFHKQKIYPKQFLEYVDLVDFSVEQTFLDALRKIHQPKKPKVKKQVVVEGEKSLSAREKETLLMLVATMAIKGYAYDPNKSKNSCTSDIRTDLELLGFSMDDKTILKWLREAAGLVYKGYWDKD